jgi:hypothetical protein
MYALREEVWTASIRLSSRVSMGLMGRHSVGQKEVRLEDQKSVGRMERDWW